MRENKMKQPPGRNKTSSGVDSGLNGNRNLRSPTSRNQQERGRLSITDRAPNLMKSFTRNNTLRVFIFTSVAMVFEKLKILFGSTKD
ncbi:hypothetical protein CEXT_20311 [Caerostris extrusa]|uniref:Uncharacterized protein n=1 Tax=Caerostris extrusa TaxID=172846 RepID=A0AAV4TG52_CAEEX|nr:hypothetical protein CEXT_20311 [Caerostris extrusa]